MALITKSQLLEKHYGGVLTEEVFDDMQRRYQIFRTIDGGVYDEQFLPRPDAKFLTIYARVKAELPTGS
jgi:hypothetical protein